MELAATMATISEESDLVALAAIKEDMVIAGEAQTRVKISVRWALEEVAREVPVVQLSAEALETTELAENSTRRAFLSH